MLRWRLIIAAALIAILAVAGWLDLQFPLLGRPGLWLIPLAVAAVVLASAEMLSMLRAAGIQPAAWAVYAGNVLIVVFAAAPLAWREYPADCPLGKSGWPLIALAAAVMLVFVAEMLRYRQAEGVILNLAGAVLAVAYVGFLFSFFVPLRLLGHVPGFVAVLSVIVVVKASDTGAYVAGRLLGRRLFGNRPMAPVLSPKKTWEGAAGAVLAGVGASWVMFAWIAPWLAGGGAPLTAWWGWLAYGVVLSITGMIGDLAESLLKRSAGQKDSSQWLIGLGGVLDVIDSLLPAAPVAWLFWAAKIVVAGV